MIALSVMACAAPDSHGDAGNIPTVYWSDDNSRLIDGTPFRLAIMDVPETGGVGARGGAKCEGERAALGYMAKAFMVA